MKKSLTQKYAELENLYKYSRDDAIDQKNKLEKVRDTLSSMLNYNNNFKTPSLEELLGQLKGELNELRASNNREGRMVEWFNQDQINTDAKLWYLLRVALGDETIPKLDETNPRTLSKTPFNDPKFNQ